MTPPFAFAFLAVFVVVPPETKHRCLIALAYFHLTVILFLQPGSRAFILQTEFGCRALSSRLPYHRAYKHPGTFSKILLSTTLRTVLLRYRVVRVDRCGSGTCGMNEVHVYVPCKLETSRSLQAARPPCSLQTARPPFQRTTCTCVPWRDNFKENREKCHDFIVLYCVKLGGISVVENLVRHNNRSFRANKFVIVSPNYKQENE